LSLAPTARKPAAYLPASLSFALSRLGQDWSSLSPGAFAHCTGAQQDAVIPSPHPSAGGEAPEPCIAWGWPALKAQLAGQPSAGRW